MPRSTSWAYDFACDRSVEELLRIFNEAGPWQWALHESAWYGDYLNTRPTEGVHARVHEYPQMGEGGTFQGERDKGFMALLQIEGESGATRAEIDAVFRGLLSRADAAELRTIEPYD
jgi:hypothetical protein